MASLIKKLHGKFVPLKLNLSHNRTNYIIKVTLKSLNVIKNWSKVKVKTFTLLQRNYITVSKKAAQLFSTV